MTATKLCLFPISPAWFAQISAEHRAGTPSDSTRRVIEMAREQAREMGAAKVVLLDTIQAQAADPGEWFIRGACEPIVLDITD